MYDDVRVGDMEVLVNYKKLVIRKDSLTTER